MDFRGFVALITGSTSGIGLGIARGLAAKGASVMLNGLESSEKMSCIRTELAQEYNVEVMYVQADMLKPTDILSMIKCCENVFGHVDILVNNAGMQYVAPVETFPPDKWDAIISLGTTVPFHTIRAVLPGMRKRKWGRIINTASAHALVASPFKSAYVASKHALAGLTKSIALETARDGVTVNAIAPGYVWTSLVETQIPETMKARNLTEEEVKNDVLLAAQPTKQFVTVEQIAALVCFLASKDAASITGAILPIDGGWTAQ
ncbi:MAG: 3-hydroxybutyrate dehydrogenase [Alphaproteobacteria bacterium]|nr:3-hydroxybutyrate dehydrogenase [Alphaproteobacteria bacterium]